MKIKPSINKSAPFYPTLIAAAGAVLTGCDKQKAPGLVPFEQKPEAPEKSQTPPGAVGVQPSGMWGEPLKLGGEAIETPERELFTETPELQDEPILHTPDTDEE